MPVWLLVKSACLASSAACFYQPVPRSGSWHFCHYFLGLICALTQCRLSPRLLSSPVSSSWNSSPVNPSVCINSPFSFPWPYSLVAIPLWLILLASPQVPQYLSLLLGFGQCCSSHHRCWFIWGVIGWVQFRWRVFTQKYYVPQITVIWVRVVPKFRVVSVVRQASCNIPHFLWVWAWLNYLTFLVAQTVKCLPTLREIRVQSLGWEDLLEKEMATHSSILAWRIPRMEEPGRLQSMGLQRVGHDWATSMSMSI